MYCNMLISNIILAMQAYYFNVAWEMQDDEKEKNVF